MQPIFNMAQGHRCANGDCIIRLLQLMQFVNRFQGNHDGILLTIPTHLQSQISGTGDEGGVGRIGVNIGPVAYERHGPVQALVQSVRFNVQITQRTFQVLGKIFSGRLAAKSALSGPIEIAAMSGAAARSGFNNLLYLMGVISISIAILNLLPIPVLDGGQIFILLIESLRRRDLSLQFKERINQFGFLMIVMLMIVVLYFDLAKNVPTGLLPGS